MNFNKLIRKEQKKTDSNLGSAAANVRYQPPPPQGEGGREGGGRFH